MPRAQINSPVIKGFLNRRFKRFGRYRAGRCSSAHTGGRSRCGFPGMKLRRCLNGPRGGFAALRAAGGVLLPGQLHRQRGEKLLPHDRFRVGLQPVEIDPLMCGVLINEPHILPILGDDIGMEHLPGKPPRGGSRREGGLLLRRNPSRPPRRSRKTVFIRPWTRRPSGSRPRRLGRSPAVWVRPSPPTRRWGNG